MMKRVFDFEADKEPKAEKTTESQLNYCPLCSEPNRTTRVNCHRCGQRLPWAEVAESGTVRPPVEVPAGEQKLDNELKRLGFLPDHPKCRYCNQPIEVYAHQCPHCGRWLGARSGKPALDPWRPDYKGRTSAKFTNFDPAVAIGVLLFVIAGAIVWLFLR